MNVPAEFNEIKDRYEKFLAAPFPMGHRSKMVGNRSLALVQSELGGFILTYLQTSGSLGSRQRISMEQTVADLKAAMSDFAEEGQTFFSELVSISEMVLRSAHDQPSF
ncbi:MAG: hypothetical protein KDD70_00135 [Bdellovibrionales bacterium]|nr:hypothetical protein [Bdellovibrionales bacterium]